MKKWTKWLVVLLVAVFMVAGCGKKSGLEGKVVDGKGQPISGLKVIAEQIAPQIKGYEHFETSTGSDGTFEFKKLYPSAQYVISVWHKDWSTDAGAQVTAGPEGETTLLKKPIQIWMAVNTEGNPMNPQTNKPRFVISNDGVITDSLTGLEWLLGPDNETTCEQARVWCRGLSVAGFGWRMPQRAELKTLYIAGLGENNMAPIFRTTGVFVWSGEQRDSSSAWGVLFTPRLFRPSGEGWDYCNSADSTRAFAVRTEEDKKIAAKKISTMKEQVLLTAKSIAKQCENYLLSHPDLKREDFYYDPEFGPITSQSVGKTGFSWLIQEPEPQQGQTWMTWSYPNPNCVGMSVICTIGNSTDRDNFYKIITDSQGKKESEGFYLKKDPDGETRKKFMAVAPIEIPGKPFSIACEVTVDEYFN